MGAGAVVPLTVFGGASSFIQARRTNRAIQSQIAAEQEAVNVSARQQAQRAAQQRQEIERSAAQVRGRLRVVAGATGLETATLDRQAAFDLSRNVALIEGNLASNLDALRTNAQGRVTGFSAQTVSPVLRATQGAITGFVAGVNIAQGAASLRSMNTASANLESANTDALRFDAQPFIGPPVAPSISTGLAIPQFGG